MKKISVLAVLAAMAIATTAYAQDVSISAEVSASAEVSTPDLSSELSSASSEVSSALSSEMSSESSMMSSMEPVNCGTASGDLDASTMSGMAIDEAALAAVASVTVIAVGDCSGLPTIDGGASATLSTHPAVIDALAAQGETGAEIIAYNLSDTSLTVYVRRR